jgi:hypothetical protein
MDKRSDLYTAALVDAVLQSAAREGIGVSAKAFERIRLSVELARRLSCHPAERRPLKFAPSDKVSQDDAKQSDTHKDRRRPIWVIGQSPRSAVG